MPHMQRKISDSGFYHVVTKGDGEQIIFENDANRQRYLSQLSDALDAYKINLHAYCLMSNHVHLLVEDLAGDLSGFMKQLSERYAMYYRDVTGRVGHVFQGRFWSEPIESDAYFLSTLRYIHRNPEPARICKAKDYPWSSYRAYIYGSKTVETSLAMGMLGGVAEFESFHDSGGYTARPFPKSALSHHLYYDELLWIAAEILGRDTVNTLKTLTPTARLPYLQQLECAGFSEPEIARITGIGRTTIHRQLKCNNGDSPHCCKTALLGTVPNSA